MNSVIKKARGKRIISVKETIKILHQEVKSQEEKLNMSLIGRGEWQLKNEVKGVLQITKQKYSSMNSEMRIRYIQQLGICMLFFFLLGRRENALPLYFVRPKFVTVITHHIRTYYMANIWLRIFIVPTRWRHQRYTISRFAEVHPEAYQTSKMKIFVKISWFSHYLFLQKAPA